MVSLFCLSPSDVMNFTRFHNFFRSFSKTCKISSQRNVCLNYLLDHEPFINVPRRLLFRKILVGPRWVIYGKIFFFFFFFYSLEARCRSRWNWFSSQWPLAGSRLNVHQIKGGMFQLKENKQDAQFEFSLKQNEIRKGEMCLGEFFKAANCNVSLLVFTPHIISIKWKIVYWRIN